VSMPVSWGTSDKSVEGRMSDIHQYAKWFDLLSYDFSLKNFSGRWECLAWSRIDDRVCFRGEQMSGPIEALHDCYSKMRDLGMAPK
jgi:hypothetical protein